MKKDINRTDEKEVEISNLDIDACSIIERWSSCNNRKKYQIESHKLTLTPMALKS